MRWSTLPRLEAIGGILLSTTTSEYYNFFSHSPKETVITALSDLPLATSQYVRGAAAGGTGLKVTAGEHLAGEEIGLDQATHGAEFVNPAAQDP
jgi:hypothetical protein